MVSCSFGLGFRATANGLKPPSTFLLTGLQVCICSIGWRVVHRIPGKDAYLFVHAHICLCLCVCTYCLGSFTLQGWSQNLHRDPQVQFEDTCVDHAGLFRASQGWFLALVQEGSKNMLVLSPCKNHCLGRLEGLPH